MGVPDQEFIFVLRLQAYKREEKTTKSSPFRLVHTLGFTLTKSFESTKRQLRTQTAYGVKAYPV